LNVTRCGFEIRFCIRFALVLRLIRSVERAEFRGRLLEWLLAQEEI